MANDGGWPYSRPSLAIRLGGKQTPSTESGLCQFPHSLWPSCMVRAGYFLGEVNCCLRVMPFPSSMVTIWPAATPVRFSLLPSGQRTDISAAVAVAQSEMHPKVALRDEGTTAADLLNLLVTAGG